MVGVYLDFNGSFINPLNYYHKTIHMHIFHIQRKTLHYIYSKSVCLFVDIFFLQEISKGFG